MLGAGKRASMAEQFKISARNLGYACRIYSYESELEVPIAEFAEIIKGSKFSDEYTLSDIRKIIAEKKIHIVIPFHDAAVSIANQLRDVVFVPVSNPEAIEIYPLPNWLQLLQQLLSQSMVPQVKDSSVYYLKKN
jgi:hypothetical protein